MELRIFNQTHNSYFFARCRPFWCQRSRDCSVPSTSKIRWSDEPVRT